MSFALSTAPQWQSFRQRLTKLPITGLVAGLLAVSLAACGGGNGSSTISSLVGTLDKTFGKAGDGTVTLSLGAGNDLTKGMVVQADGKVLLVGSSTSTVAGTTSSNITVERFNTDGTLDTSFGAGNNDGSPDGVVSLSLGDGSEEGTAIAVQADGKIVVAGVTTSVIGSNSKNIVVARLNTDGSLDKMFGAGNVHLRH